MNALVSIQQNWTNSFGVTSDVRQQNAEELQSMQTARLTAALEQAGLLTKSADAAKSDDEVTEAIDNTLDRDAFLQLLVLEMQNQDPMEPMDNSEMIAQLAQFSSLEQMQALNDSFETLSGNIDQLNFISATSLIGQTVAAVNGEGEIVQGVVESVTMDDSVVYMTVDDQLVSMAGVLAVTSTSTEETE